MFTPREVKALAFSVKSLAISQITLCFTDV